MVLYVTTNALDAVHAQCTGYSVEVFAAPDCSILPSFAGARGIADDGGICGGYVDCGENGHSVIWDAVGEITELPLSAEGGFPGPLALNSLKEVVGQLSIPKLSPLHRAFLYSKGVTVNLGTLPGHNQSEAIAINESGVTCGVSRNTNVGPLSAFIWQNGKMEALNLPLGPNSIANDISNDGAICGWMGHTPDVDAHAFIWSNGKTSDLGVIPSGVTGVATSINSYHNVCGWGKVNGTEGPVAQGFFWSGGDFEIIDPLPGFSRCFPRALNDSNVVVGSCDNIPKSGVTGAFVWHNGVSVPIDDLIPGDLNLTVRNAWGINNAGQIVGDALLLDGSFDRVAVRLTPIPSPIGDSDCDDDIDVDDLLTVINHWADTSPKGSNALPPGDFDHDGVVELDDLAIVLDNWTF